MIKMCYPQGKEYVVTMSYDDGQIHDRRLVEMFNRYGIKGTFHLNSERFGTDQNQIVSQEIKALYQGHEVSCHTCTHPHLNLISKNDQIQQVRDDRKHLEALVGYPVCGMSYPYGTYNDDVLDTLRQCGIVYSRTVKSTKAFSLPQDFLLWHPSCHHKESADVVDAFLRCAEHHHPTPLLYIWGHSYEFAQENTPFTWEDMEALCQKLAHRDYIWYATNIEIYRYVQAQKNLIFACDNSFVENPSAISVWVLKDKTPIEIPAGQTVTL